VTEDSATITLGRHDPVAQRITRQHVTVDAQGIQLLPVALRYCWPSELDLMAQLAGLRLRERYSDWSRTPFDDGSGAYGVRGGWGVAGGYRLSRSWSLLVSRSSM
jgi:hypothetical protein